jgi:iron complex transport system substrate-binding protein
MLLLMIIFFKILVGSSANALECSKEPILKTFSPKHAVHFKIYYHKKFKRLEVDKYQFFLTSDSDLKCSDATSIIHSPVKSIGLTSTTYLPSLIFLKKEKSLKAFQGISYIVSSNFNKKEISELNFKLSAEKMISLKLDLLIAYEANLNSTKDLNLFKSLRIPIVMNKDYEETTPLARAEWIIFNASLFDQEEEAQKYFSMIEENYQKLKIQNQKEVLKPSVLVGSIQNGFWLTCGGISDLAQMIEDAGASLAFKNNRASSQQVSLEEFALKKNYYDYWLPHNEWKSSFELAGAKKSDSRYQFIQTRKIFNNTLVLNKDNFNDYWEEGMQRPDLVLLDLSAIFHPNSFKNHKMRWYKQL